MKKALLVIDVQRYFLQRSPEDLPRKIADHIHSSNYDFVGFTLFRNLPSSNWKESLGWEKCQSDEDLALPKEFNDLANFKNVFEKNTYSALKPPVNLLRELQERKIEQIDLCGIDTEACVLATAYDAFDRGFRVKVLFDLSYSRVGLDEAAKSIILRTLQIRASNIK